MRNRWFIDNALIRMVGEMADDALSEIELLPIRELILVAELVRSLRPETRERRLATLVKAAQNRGAYLERQAAAMRVWRGKGR